LVDNQTSFFPAEANAFSRKSGPSKFFAKFEAKKGSVPSFPHSTFTIKKHTRAQREKTQKSKKSLLFLVLRPNKSRSLSSKSRSRQQLTKTRGKKSPRKEGNVGGEPKQKQLQQQQQRQRQRQQRGGGREQLRVRSMRTWLLNGPFGPNCVD
jgi:hypothetical protein